MLKPEKPKPWQTQEAGILRRPRTLAGGSVGGLSRAEAVDPANLVRPTSSDGGWGRARAATSAGQAPLQLEERTIAEMVLEALTRSVAASTNKTYFKAWSEWLQSGRK